MLSTASAGRRGLIVVAAALALVFSGLSLAPVTSAFADPGSDGDGSQSGAGAAPGATFDLNEAQRDAGTSGDAELTMQNTGEGPQGDGSQSGGDTDGTGDGETREPAAIIDLDTLNHLPRSEAGKTIFTAIKLTRTDGTDFPANEAGDLVISTEEEVRVQYTWAIPESLRPKLQEGDWFDFTVPDMVQVGEFALQGELKDADNRVFAHYVINTDRTARITLTDMVTQASNITGDLGIRFWFTDAVTEQSGKHILDVPFVDDGAGTSIVISTPTEKLLHKYVYSRTQNNAVQDDSATVDWGIIVNEAEQTLLNAKVTEILPDNVTDWDVKSVVYAKYTEHNWGSTWDSVGTVPKNTWSVDRDAKTITLPPSLDRTVRIVVTTKIENLSDKATPSADIYNWQEKTRATFTNRATLQTDNHPEAEAAADVHFDGVAKWSKALDEGAYDEDRGIVPWVLTYTQTGMYMPVGSELAERVRNMEIADSSGNIIDEGALAAEISRQIEEQTGSPMPVTVEKRTVNAGSGEYGYHIFFGAKLTQDFTIRFYTHFDSATTPITKVMSNHLRWNGAMYPTQSINVPRDKGDNVRKNVAPGPNNGVAVDFQDQTATWQVLVNPNRVAMDTWTLNDGTSNPWMSGEKYFGTTTIPDIDFMNLAVYDVTGLDAAAIADPAAAGLTPLSSSEYAVSKNQWQTNSFTLKRTNTAETRDHTYLVTLRTQFEPNAIRITNKATLTFADNNVRDDAGKVRQKVNETTAEFVPADFGATSLTKDGAFDPRTGRITWTLDAHGDPVEGFGRDAKILDEIPEGQTYADGSLTSTCDGVSGAMDGDGTLVIAGFPKAHVGGCQVSFATIPQGEVGDDGRTFLPQGTVTNHATLWDRDHQPSRDSATVSFNEGASLLSKSAVEYAIDGTILYSITVNPDKLRLQDVVLRDDGWVNVAPDPATIVVRDSTGDEVDPETYQVDAGRTYFQVFFPGSLDDTYTVAYVGKPVPPLTSNATFEVRNHASLHGRNIRETQVAAPSTVEVKTPQVDGSARGETLTLQFHKVSERTALDGSPIPLEGAQFQLLARDKSGAFTMSVDKQTSAPDGAVRFQDLLVGEYLLREIVPPNGHSSTPELRDGLILSLDPGNLRITSETQGFLNMNALVEDTGSVAAEGTRVIKFRDALVNPVFTKTVVKEWVGDEDVLHVRPETVAVQLLADGEKLGAPVILREDMGEGVRPWAYQWSSLPKYDPYDPAHPEIEYTLREVNASDMYASSVTDDGTTFTVTNTLKDASFELVKLSSEVDSEGAPMRLPGAVFHLLEIDEGGSTVGSPIVLTTGEDGVARTAVKSDTPYRLVETSAPVGHELGGSGGVIGTYMVSDGVMSLVPGAAGPQPVNTAADGASLYRLVIENTPKASPAGDQGITITKVLEGQTPPHELAFAFSLKLVGGEPANVVFPDGSAVGEDGYVAFQTPPVARFTAPGEVAGIKLPQVYFRASGVYEFAIAEVNDGTTGVTYDDTVYRVRFNVTMDGEKGLSANATVIEADGTKTLVNPSAGRELRFVNGYAPLPVASAPVITKHVETVGAKHPTMQPVSFLTRALDSFAGGVAFPEGNTATIPGAKLLSKTRQATVTSMPAQFTQAGTHQLEISEVLPAEGEAPGWTWDGTPVLWTVKVVDNGGRLTIAEESFEKGGVVTGGVKFGNRYTAGAVSAAPAIEKRIELRGDITGTPEATFRFQMVPADGNPDGAVLPGSGADGTAAGVVTATKEAGDVATDPVIPFGRVTFTDEGEYSFDITELGGLPEGWSDDDQMIRWTVRVADDEAGSLAVVEQSYSVDDPAFTNVFTPQPVEFTPQVTKSVSASRGAKVPEASFDFELKGHERDEAVEAPVRTASLSTAQLGDDGVGTVSVPAIRFAEAGEYSFTIREQGAAGVEAPGWAHDRADVTMEVVVVEDPAAPGTLRADATYVKADDTFATAPFTNTYDPAPAKAAAQVSKALNLGAGLTAADAPERTFEFELKPADAYGDAIDIGGASALTASLTAADVAAGADGVGTATFANVTFNEVGTYSFTMSEVVPDPVPAGWTDDGRQYEWRVEVTDNGAGNLEATGIVLLGGQMAQGGARFTDTYQPGEVSAKPDVRKFVSSTHAIPDTAFGFTLTPDSLVGLRLEGAGTTGASETRASVRAHAVADNSPDADHAVPFAPVTFTEAGVFQFTIAEDVPEGTDDGWTYDRSRLRWIVRVADDGAGKLAVTESTYHRDGSEVEAATFVNSYEPKATEATAAFHKIVKVLRGDLPSEPIDQPLSFALSAAAGTETGFALPDQRLLTVPVDDVLSDSVEQLAFDPVTFSAAGAYTFEITELTPAHGIPGWSYDPLPLTWNVTVEDNGGALEVVDQSYVTGDYPGATIVNVYNPGRSMLPGPGDDSGMGGIAGGRPTDAGTVTFKPEVGKVVAGPVAELGADEKLHFTLDIDPTTAPDSVETIGGDTEGDAYTLTRDLGVTATVTGADLHAGAGKATVRFPELALAANQDSYRFIAHEVKMAGDAAIPRMSYDDREIVIDVRLGTDARTGDRVVEDVSYFRSGEKLVGDAVAFENTLGAATVGGSRGKAPANDTTSRLALIDAERAGDSAGSGVATAATADAVIPGEVDRAEVAGLRLARTTGGATGFALARTGIEAVWLGLAGLFLVGGGAWMVVIGARRRREADEAN